MSDLILTDSPGGAVPRTARRRLAELLAARGVWALFDQGVLSLGNFLVALLLARTLPETDFGVYAFVLTILLLLNNLHGALLGYALTVRGATADDTTLRRLLSVTLLLTLGLGAGAIPLLAGSVWAFGHPEVIPSAALAMLMWTLQETARRGLLARLRYRSAILGDAVSYLGQLIPMYLLAQEGALTVERALLINAASSATAMGIQVIQVGVARVKLAEIIAGARQAGVLGRWLLLANLIGVFVVPAIPWALAAAHGAHEVAGYQVLATVLGISHPVLFSVSNIIVPAAAQARAAGGIEAARRTAFRYAAYGAAMLAPYYLVLLLMPDLTLRIIYGADSPYLDLGEPLRMFVLYYILLFVWQVLVALMNGLEKTAANFHTQAVAAIVTIAVVVPSALIGGLPAASAARVLQGVCAAAAAVWLWRRVWAGARSAPGTEAATC